MPWYLPFVLSFIFIIGAIIVSIGSKAVHEPLSRIFFVGAVGDSGLVWMSDEHKLLICWGSKHPLPGDLILELTPAGWVLYHASAVTSAQDGIHYHVAAYLFGSVIQPENQERLRRNKFDPQLLRVKYERR